MTLTACFGVHDDIAKGLWSAWFKILKQNTEYFTHLIYTMRVAKDAVDANIVANIGGASISRTPRYSAFCKPLLPWDRL